MPFFILSCHTSASFNTSLNILSNNTPEKWEQIRTHPFYAPYLEKLKKEGEGYLTSQVPVLQYTDYLRYRKDGDRTCYETPYFQRRRRVAVLTILTKLYGEAYLPALLNVIWAITEEFTWCLPAHLPEAWYHERGYRTTIDLFATETGALLAQTVYLLGDALPAQTVTRIRALVTERVMDAYKAGVGSPWWMDSVDNWGAVCTYQTAMCFLYFGEEKDLYFLEPHFDRTMNLFLASYGNDGCCMEGLGYWTYGFGSFLCYADAMRNYSREHAMVSKNEGRPAFDGKPYRNAETGVIDYFLREDVRRTVDFPLGMYLRDGFSVPFSDCARRFSYCRSVYWLLKREYPDAVTYPDASFVQENFGAGSLNLVRHLLWSDPDAVCDETEQNGTVFFEEAGWFIKRTDRYALAVKAGCNAEPHNHNDVGSFHLIGKNGESFVDLGAGAYTGQYFKKETRYEHLVTRSLGHSVPLVEGGEQVFTPRAAHVLESTDDVFAFDMAPLYENENLRSVVRRFETDEEGVTISDTFSFSDTPGSITERFVSCLPPVVERGSVVVGDARLSFDATLFAIRISQEEYKDHFRVTQTAYFVDLTPKTLVANMRFSFRIDMQG